MDLTAFQKFIRLYGIVEYQKLHRQARKYYAQKHPERSLKGLVMHNFGETVEDYYDFNKYEAISRGTHMRLNWLTKKNAAKED